MINHLRTLLLNLPGSSGTPGIPGEEIIDPNFIPLTLSADQMGVYATLFGASPDRAYLNYIVRNYLTILHNGPLAEYVAAFDPRITYSFEDQFYFNSAFLPTVTPLDSGSDNRQLFFTGNLLADDARGKANFSWKVSLSSGAVTVAEQSPDVNSSTTTPGVSNNLVGPFPLGISGLSASIDGTANGNWLVNIWARPGKDLSEVVKLLDSFASVIFIGSGEPIQSCYNLWNSIKPLPDRLSAFLLAYGISLNGLLRG